MDSTGRDTASARSPGNQIGSTGGTITPAADGSAPAAPTVAPDDVTGSLPATPSASPAPTSEPTPSPTATATEIVPQPEPAEIRIQYAAVVSRRLQVRDISFDDLARVWRGEGGHWGNFGEPGETPIIRYTIDNSVLPIDPFGGDFSVPNYDELAEVLWRDRGGIALVPRHLVDFRVRTLRVDGEDSLRFPNDGHPLTLKLFGVPEEVAPETLVPRPAPVMMTFVGDIIFGRFVHQRMAALGDFASAFRAVADELQRADITIGDLECSMSDNYPQPELENPQTFSFKTGSATVAGLELADIDILSRANNHSFNFGAGGMDDTTAVLDQAGILHFGMGHNLEEARRPVTVQLGDVSYAFLGYNGISDQWDGATEGSAGTAPMLDWLVADDVGRAVEAGHIVIPYFHWGVEYVSLPTEQQRYFARVAIDSGAAMVMGSHPHWVQAVETYNGKPIVYSLGNFVFDQAWSRETLEGMYANIWLEGGRILGLDLIPVLIEDEHRPRRMNEWEAFPVLERVWEATEIVRSWG
jgi:poly-gamma-glutamate synthesis protein (capsule biosynthesis protein)